MNLLFHFTSQLPLTVSSMVLFCNLIHESGIWYVSVFLYYIQDLFGSGVFTAAAVTSLSCCCCCVYKLFVYVTGSAFLSAVRNCWKQAMMSGSQTKRMSVCCTGQPSTIARSWSSKNFKCHFCLSWHLREVWGITELQQFTFCSGNWDITCSNILG